jgi:tripartite-type tricarboxylate transporter receptor subunit TctC
MPFRVGASIPLLTVDPLVMQRLKDLNSDIPPMDKVTPAGLKTHLEAEIIKWAPVIRKAGIYAD